jgi:hypothetical protein
LTADGIVITPKLAGGSTVVREVEIIADQFGYELTRGALHGNAAFQGWFYVPATRKNPMSNR